MTVTFPVKPVRVPKVRVAPATRPVLMLLLAQIVPPLMAVMTPEMPVPETLCPTTSPEVLLRTTELPRVEPPETTVAVVEDA